MPKEGRNPKSDGPSLESAAMGAVRNLAPWGEGTDSGDPKETMFFLRMAAASEPSLADEARKLWREAKELNLIFGSIWRKRS